MKHLKIITRIIFAAAFFYLAFPQTIFAATEEEHIMTIPQLLILGVVLGWYLYNHFKDKIKAMFKKNDG
jgi:4-amino-4-deoxy-L-arabinose transferase-like glycosyltransferase